MVVGPLQLVRLVAVPATLLLVGSACQLCTDRAWPNGLLVEVATDQGYAGEVEIEIEVEDWTASIECSAQGECFADTSDVPKGWEIYGESRVEKGKWTVGFSVRAREGSHYFGPDQLEFALTVDETWGIGGRILPEYETMVDDDGSMTCGTYEFARVEYFVGVGA